MAKRAPPQGALAKQAARKSLTREQSTFLREVLSNGGKLAAAYRIAYPGLNLPAAEIARRASRLARQQGIRAALVAARARADAAVALAAERYGIDRQRAIERLWRWAFTDMDQLADVVRITDEGGGTIGRQVIVRDIADIEPEARGSIAKLRQGRDGITVELVDRRACLMDAARLMGWVTDQPIDSARLVTLKIER